MNNQARGPSNQANDMAQKTPPSVELSLKYMAWDIKGIVPAIKELTAELRALRLARGGQVPVDSPDNFF